MLSNYLVLTLITQINGFDGAGAVGVLLVAKLRMKGMVQISEMADGYNHAGTKSAQ